MKRPTERFSGRVENYVKYRPGYPSEVLHLLQDQCGLKSESVAADIGCGTGLLARLLLQTGCKVYGVEPNKEMRSAAEALLRHEPRFVSVDATAESTSLQLESVDLITAAQAFHWFDRERARSEFQRIGRPGAWLAILWNTRLTDDTAFLSAYEVLLKRHASDYAKVDHRNVTAEAIADFFAPARVACAIFRNSQQFDFNGLAGRLLSSSYAPNAGQPGYIPMMEDLRRLFDEHQDGGKVEFLYDTVLYYGRIR